MMLKLITLFFAVGCSIGGALVTGCNTNRNPDIAFESISHEFPNPFIVGTKILKRFEFTNKGNAPLEIQDIHTNCGCVATTPSAAQIPPGGTGSIQIEIDPEVGPFLEQAFVYTNDPDKPMIPLQVSGIIKSAITYPKKIDVGQYEKGQNVSKTITFTNNTANAIEITEHAGSRDSIVVTLLDRIIPIGKSVDVQATLSFNKVGFYNETLILSVHALKPFPGTDSDTAELSVQLQGRVLGDIVVLPTNLFLGVMPPNQPVQRTIQLKTDGTQAFAVLGIAADTFDVSAEWNTEKRTSHELFISISANGALKGLVEDTISIQTDHPDVASIEISVKGVLP